MLYRRGRIERLSRGVYRFPEWPAGDLDQYVAATYWPIGVRGVLSHETALERHGLCDVNPSKVDLTLPAAYEVNPRRDVPEYLRLHFEDLATEDVGAIEGVPVVEPVLAIVQCVDAGLRTGLIDEAVAALEDRGLLRPADRKRIVGARKGLAT